MANYRGVILNKKAKYIEDDSFEVKVIIFDDENTQITSLSDYKFNAYIGDDGGYEVEKQDANYAGGSNNEILVSNGIITVYVNEDETTNFDGDDFWFVLQMIHKTTSDKYTLIRTRIEFVDEIPDA